MRILMKRTVVVLMVLAALLALSGCAKPTPQSTSDPDAVLLAGLWEQFIPITSMPVEIRLDSSGAAQVDSEAGRWKLDRGVLSIRHGSQEDRYIYTVSGYMLTLIDTQSDTSEFYINPDAFAAGADKNADLKGQWAAWSTFAMMAFDGGTELDNIVYTTAGREDLMQKYAARDGILQASDSSGNYTYNLYAFAEDGALLLAETTDYDSDNKQWTPYWKKAEPDDGLLAQWQQVIDTDPTSDVLPATMKLNGDGTGTAALPGKAPAPIRWDYYSGGFAVIEYSETDLQYAWCTAEGAVLNLSNPETEDAWYTDASRFLPSFAPLKPVLGKWKLVESELALDFRANGTVVATGEAGQTTTLTVTAADGLLKLLRGGSTYYMAYSVEEDTMKVYYGPLPFLDQKEMPVPLDKVQ